MNYIHLIMIPFTGVGLQGGFRGQEWYRERIEIFKKYTLKSLQHQTNKNFVVWVTFRPQEENNPLTTTIAEALKEANIPYIFTFNGLMYHDDKFGGTFTSKIKNAGRIIRSAWRNKTGRDIAPALRELFQDKNTTLVERIGKSIDVLRPYFKETEWVYLTRLDSDDMFRDNFVHIVQSISFDVELIACNRGYIYNTEINEVAEYNPKTNPPFHTLIFPKDTFFSPQLHKEFYRGYTSHEDIEKLFPLRCILQDRMYCVTTRNPKLHISTTWVHPYRGRIITGYTFDNGMGQGSGWEKIAYHHQGKSDAEKILQEFGL